MSEQKKIFCIGLHKTGTTSLHEIAIHNNLKTTHTCNWDSNTKQLNKYDFFCDGGSHYNNIKEINYKNLYEKYPNSIFIINIRDVRSWIISKLKHAGWNANTVIRKNKKIILHKKWRDKTKQNIMLFICHYFDRYIKILEFFLDKQDKAFIVDVVSGKIDNLKFLFQREYGYKNVHENKGKSHKLSNKILTFINNQINMVNKYKYEKLRSLLKMYKY